MKSNNEYIHQLMSEKIAGIISAAEEAYLDELIENDPIVQNKWAHFTHIVGENQPNLFHENLSQEMVTPPWPSYSESKKKRIKHPATLLKIAAIGLFILSIALFLFTQYNSSDSSPLVFQMEEENHDHIKLKLADGSEINLSEKVGAIDLANGRLQNDRRTLSLQQTHSDPSKSQDDITFQELIIPVGQDYIIELEDGSKIHLNSATRLKFPFAFSKEKREIYIQGEAYLEIEKEHRPFIVHLPHSDVEVLGTSFNINSYDKSQDKVALVEGKVRMHANSEEQEISPGNMVTFTQEKGWTRSEFDPHKVLAWQKGLFYFYDANLLEICEVLPRWFGLNIVIDNPEIKSKRFAGILDRNQPIEVFLEDLQSITQIAYSIDWTKKEIHIKIPTN